MAHLWRKACRLAFQDIPMISKQCFDHSLRQQASEPDKTGDDDGYYSKRVVGHAGTYHFGRWADTANGKCNDGSWKAQKDNSIKILTFRWWRTMYRVDLMIQRGIFLGKR